jgi:hypothetical protein
MDSFGIPRQARRDGYSLSLALDNDWVERGFALVWVGNPSITRGRYIFTDLARSVISGWVGGVSVGTSGLSDRVQYSHSRDLSLGICSGGYRWAWRVRVIRRILTALATSGQRRMRTPIIIYSTVISLMLLSAMMKMTDFTWNANAGALVSIGAFLFYISDIILAWHKFVAPIQHGRIYNIGAYHLGQIILIAGVIAQFGS